MKCIILPLLLAVSTFASAVTINNPKNGGTVTSPFLVSGSAATCSGQKVIQIGYSIDSGADVLSPQVQTLDLTATASPGEHTVHVEVRGKSGSACESDVEITVSQATPRTSTGTTYYLSPTGKDSNSGTSASAPWLTPNHAVNCGDVILAAAGTYSNSHFVNTFGTVACSAGNNVAWLKCATFDTCKISATTNQGIEVNKSYWGVQGWEVTTAASDTYGTCFNVKPGSSEISHVIFANNVANGCSDYGFLGNYTGSHGADYVAIIGNIAYNAAQGTASCASGITIFGPSASDSVAGTHIYIAGNFSYGNLDHDPCAGGVPSDGEGIILDTLNQNSYNQQIAIENNIMFRNGGRGFEENANAAANVHIDHNTIAANNDDPHQDYWYCSDLQLGNNAHNTTATYDLVASNSASGCGGNTPLYALGVLDSATTTNHVEDSYIYGVGGYNTTAYGSSGFSAGPNDTIGTNPELANPVNPGAPKCSGKASVPACMATAIADYKPTNTAALSYGYQTPSSTPDTDPLFPKWLCNVNLPSGLVTEGCAE